MKRFYWLGACLIAGCGSVTAQSDAAGQSDTSGGSAADASPDAPSKIIKVAIYDDYDPDFQNQPFDDRVTIVTYDVTNNVVSAATPYSGFNETQTVGASRALSVTPDGSRFAIVETGFGAIEVRDTATGMATTGGAITGFSWFSVLVTNNRIYGAPSNAQGIRVYDLTTHTEVSGSPSPMQGLDLVIDSARNVMWSAGKNLWRGDATTLAGSQLAPTYGFNAVSIDVAADGSVWVAERASTTAGTNSLHHYNSAGAELGADLKSLATYPACVRVHPMTGDLWTSGAGGLSRYDLQGPHEVDSSAAYWSIAIDKGTGIVFAAGGVDNPNVAIYSSTGTLLTKIPDQSVSQKYVAIVP